MAAVGTAGREPDPAESPTGEWYRHFGTVDAPGNSECYAEWSVGIAADPELIRRIDQWPYNKRQPLLMLAAARFLGARISPYPEFRAFLDARWDDVSRTVLSRATQTNEAGRCATLLPSLAQAAASGNGRPLALIEVGASAGLALYPDRYGYAFDAGASVVRLSPAGATPGSYPVLGCTVTGPAPLPADLPHVVWRAGIDLNPLDVRNPGDVAWLEALIWPEQDFRRERLRRAIAIARSAPPLLVSGDLNDQLLALAARAPSDATLVVFHSAVMAYLDAESRDRFRATMSRLTAERGCHWLSNEGHTVIVQADGSSVVPEMDEARLRGRFLLLHNGAPVAITGPHGQSLDWL
ncbi:MULTISPECIES: DUF2332 domain-containing protein [unclassified Arthrobacter]|uniref:DUF2332 domain-containing protein n=1 Tax=unclassified Arthrobacter TaxID=235627 RepID=UPI001CFF9E9B|nr:MULTISPECIES: DUF2332 domain-containing protein [unclassified Arthrobacter]MCB5282889.1 hypothetical protein [Arthrobacter sp. ES1]WGZ78931.1 DUF2332 domain-containing protein [Arthrobacter sp. EM1]